MPSKEELRDNLMRQRLNLRKEQIVASSQAIIQQIQDLLADAEHNNIHCFEPIYSLNEVEITPLLSYFQTRYPGAGIFTSRNVGQEWKILPITGKPHATLPEFDLIIVPMLGFADSDLHRLGYGGGYYDVLLHNNPAAKKLGVCFELGKLSDLPADPHDVPLDLVVTETKVYSR